MIQQIFINLPVKDLDKSIAFFTKLGFTFNPKFTDQNATCMIIGKNIYAMLLVEKFFSTFTTKHISDAHKNAEVINSMQLESKEKVDELMNKALKAGAKEPRPAQDLGWMYQRGFEDLDGHLWEVFFMDETKMPTNP